MSLESGYTWTHDDISLTGYSLAGITTSVAFPAADVCFDVGQGLPYQVPISNILLTHGHLDHAGGLPYLIGQKAMRRLRAPDIYMVPTLVEPMRAILDLWEGIEDHSYEYNLHAVTPGERRPLKGDFHFVPFQTHHRIPSQGYTILRKRKRLRRDLAGLDNRELARLRGQGESIDEIHFDNWISFTGDTRIEALTEPSVRDSRVALVEVTYFDEAKPVETARKWGHIHWQELVSQLDLLTCEKVVLIHTSTRYSPAWITSFIQRQLPPRHRGRVELFPRP